MASSSSSGDTSGGLERNHKGETGQIIGVAKSPIPLMDNISFWNVRGLHATNKQRELAVLCHKNKVGLFGVLESKLKENEMRDGCLRYFRGWKAAHNLQHHRGGRIWVLRNPCAFEVQVLKSHTQFLHLEVLNKAFGQVFFVTVLYGSNKLAERRVLWEQLCTIATVCGPWLIGGISTMFWSPWRDKRVVL